MPAITPGQADQLIRAAQQHGADYRNAYSGRGMYGKTCIGLAGSMTAITRTCITASRADPALAELLSFTGAATDSMGLDVIMYWPELAEETR